MTDANDIALLREYARCHSEAAFTELVRRHIHLVYSVALRCAGNDSDAQDVAQAVFIILARKAAGLHEKTLLAGWLYEATRFTAARLRRDNARRHAREQEAYMQSTLKEAEAASIWEQLSPHLEGAMSRLAERDRALLVLRFYQNKTGPEAAALLGLRENTLHKRVARALEKLRMIFAKQGVTLSGETIAGAISAHSIQTAPAGLANTISTVALAKSATASVSTLTLAKGALKLMAWTKTKTTIAGVAIALLLGIGTTVIVLEALLPVPDIQGTWECTLTIPAPGYGVYKGESPKTRIVMRISRENGAYQANFDNIDEGHQNIVFDTFTYKYPYVHAESSSHNDDVSCVGKVNRSGKKLSWKAREGKYTYMMVFGRTTNPTPFPEPLTDAEFAPRTGSDLQGFWAGAIGRGKSAVRIRIKIAEAYDGTFRADFYVPDQDEERQPTTVSYDGIIVKLMPMAGYGMFEGRLRNGGNEMAGVWIQDGYHTATTLTQANYSEYQSQQPK